MAVLSKYVFAYKYRHILNPVALAIVIGGVLGYGGAIWWVATPVLLLPVLLLGVLVVKKIHRFDLVGSFLATAIILHVGISIYRGSEPMESLMSTLISWPVLFFAFFMLTEPLSTPPRRRDRVVYGALVGVLSNLTFHVGPFFSSPELSLILGNIFSYAVSTHSRAVLVLKEKITLAKDTFEFVFTKPSGFVYTAGQYMEWTIPHTRADSRGVRRYFTISSTPADDTVRLGVKMYPNGSTLKQKLSKLEPGEVIYGMHPVGDFVLPADPNTPVILVAGGIGITPFMSMIRTHLTQGGTRSITLFYANKSYEEIAYLKELSESGVQVVHLLTNTEGTPADFLYERGFFTMEMIAKYVQNPHACECYVSGPHGMVVNYEKMFRNANVKQVHTDFFPGFV
jgi:ferredoxin-NADP reductase